ncbi:uncharacterized protein LOC108665664 [Hyalella azteca]|uniref:Uncharacterized protein LOC108665664 n=1 Tax=Hyalella azteca TaxID=294128 RepID=A0A8B7N3F3_HYAAZ|nr:uncharacterized protein LOC108665664 [Hyalella azteca]
MSTVKREADEDEVDRKVAAFLKSLKSSTDAVNPERRPSDSRSVSRLSTRDQSVQVIGQDRIEKMLTKLNFIVQTTTLPGSAVETPEDVKACLRYMFSVGSLLYQALSARAEKSSEPAQRERNLRLKENISKAQGCVKNTYEEDWRKRNAGPCLGDLIDVWVRACSGSNSRPVKTEHKERAAR